MPKTRWLLLLTVLLCKPAITAAGPDEATDLAAARAVFEANLEAIRKHDRAGYLSCYLESERLVRTGADGFTLGYEGLAASAGLTPMQVLVAATHSGSLALGLPAVGSFGSDWVRSVIFSHQDTYICK